MNKGKPARYRFISPSAYFVCPIVLALIGRYSPLLALGTLVAIAAVIALLSRIGSDLTSDGVDVRHLRSHSFVPWHEIAEVTTVSGFNSGQRIVIVRRGGQRVILPAPTSHTARFAEGLSRVRSEVAKTRLGTPVT